MKYKLTIGTYDIYGDEVTKKVDTINLGSMRHPNTDVRWVRIESVEDWRDKRFSWR